MARWRIVQSPEYAQVVASVASSTRAALAEVYSVLAPAAGRLAAVRAAAGQPPAGA
jgi:hypothetical protein